MDAMAALDQLDSHMVEECINLIARLYQPASPATINEISSQILKIQERSTAWKLGFTLLLHPEEKVRFYGALTLQRKINTQWDKVSTEEYADLLVKLVSCFVQLVSQHEGPLVVKKFCSTLVSYALQRPSKWEHYIRTLLCAFCSGDYVSEQAMASYPPTEELVLKLTIGQLSAMLQVSLTLADEVGKIDLRSSTYRVYHERVEADAANNVLVIDATFAAESSKLRLDALSCFSTWTFYAQRAWSDHSDSMQRLRRLIRPAMECLLHEETMDGAVELFAEIMTSFSYFLRDEDRSNLSLFLQSQVVLPRLHEIGNGDQSPEDRKLVGLYVAFADATVESLVEIPDDETSKFLLAVLGAFLSSKGHPGHDDFVSAPALEFWSTYVDHVSDAALAGTEELEWFDSALRHIARVLEACWAKAVFPSQAELDSWDSESRAAFSDFRADVKDLVQTCYPLLGPSMASRFADQALQSLQDRNWWHVEASLLFLNAMADQMAEGQNEDGILLRVFNSNLFRDIAEAPGRVSKTALSLVGSYSTLFERHPESLPPILNYLFSTLQNQALVTEASRTIFTLCSTCRRALTTYLDAFIQQYEQFLHWGTGDRFSVEKVIGAIAAIVQALPSEEGKAAPLQRLFDFIEVEAKKCSDFVAAGERQLGQEAGVTALECLASIGRAMQVPDDELYDLEPDTPGSSFWNEPEGQSIQRRILGFVVTIANLLFDDGDIIEATCQILKTGYTETKPGPFVIPAQATADLFQMTRIIPNPTPRLEAIINAACTLLTTRSTESSGRIVAEAAQMLAKATSLIIDLRGARYDPEIAQSCVDLFGRYIPRYVDVLLALDPPEVLEGMFNFTLQCLRGGDIFPKRSATVFWSSWLTLANQQHDLQMRIDQVTDHFGPQLAGTLIRQVAGDAARSELDFIAEPFKKLVFRQTKAKQWLEGAMMSETFPSQRVTEEDKRVFLKKVMGLRGGRETNQIIKEFWIACRGTSLGYTS